MRHNDRDYRKAAVDAEISSRATGEGGTCPGGLQSLRGVGLCLFIEEVYTTEIG